MWVPLGILGQIPKKGISLKDKENFDCIYYFLFRHLWADVKSASSM